MMYGLEERLKELEDRLNDVSRSHASRVEMASHMPTFGGDFIDDKFLTEVEAATFLGVSVRSLQSWRLTGKGPRFCKFEKAVRYPQSALVRWTSSRAVESTAQADRLDVAIIGVDMAEKPSVGITVLDSDEGRFSIKTPVQNAMVFLITGEGGSGKSTLAKMLLDRKIICKYTETGETHYNKGINNKKMLEDIKSCLAQGNNIAFCGIEMEFEKTILGISNIPFLELECRRDRSSW